MKLNQNTVAGKWTEIKGELLKTWGKLTSDEVDQTKGDLTAIAGLIQQRYGETQASYSNKLSEIISRFEDKKDQVIAQTKEALKRD